MPCHVHSTGASQQQAACYDIAWQVAGFNQRFPSEGRLARGCREKLLQGRRYGKKVHSVGAARLAPGRKGWTTRLGST